MPQSLLKRMAVVIVAAAVAAAAWFGIRSVPRTDPAPRDSVNTSAPAPHAWATEFADTTLEARLQRIVRSGPGRCGLMAKNLRTGATARVNADSAIPLLSVVKLPVAVVVLEGVDQGRWSLDTPITLLAQDMHPRGELGDRYPRGGGPVRLYRLLDLMVTRSDNTAADALMRLVGGPLAVTAWLEQHGIRDLRVDRTERGLGNDWYGLASEADTMGSAEDIRMLRAQVPAAVHDSAAHAMLTDPRDTGTAEACVQLLEHLWRGELLSPAMTDTLKATLARCRTAPNRLPGMLPKGTPVARKTGTGGMTAGISVAINDVGVIRLPNGDDVAIAVLVGEPNGRVQRAERLIALVAREVFDSWSAQRPATQPPSGTVK